MLKYKIAIKEKVIDFPIVNLRFSEDSELIDELSDGTIVLDDKEYLYLNNWYTIKEELVTDKELIAKLNNRLSEILENTITELNKHLNIVCKRYLSKDLGMSHLYQTMLEKLIPQYSIINNEQ